MSVLQPQSFNHLNELDSSLAPPEKNAHILHVISILEDSGQRTQPMSAMDISPNEL